MAPPYMTFKGRRLLLSSWRRATKWEFWPPWVFYPPLLVYIGYLMLKHRSATLFTAANPAIVGGGFVGESKFTILQCLAGAPSHVARFLVEATPARGLVVAQGCLLGRKR